MNFNFLGGRSRQNVSIKIKDLLPKSGIEYIEWFEPTNQWCVRIGYNFYGRYTHLENAIKRLEDVQNGNRNYPNK